MKKNKITSFIICEHAFAIYSSYLIIEECRRKGDRIQVFTPIILGQACKEYLSLKEAEWTALDTFTSPVASKLTKWFEVLFVPLDFSGTYRTRKSLKMSIRDRKIARLSHWLKFKPSTINERYSIFFSSLAHLKIIPKLPKNPDYVFAFTKSQHPYLLAPLSDRLTLIMESWDHPMKEPYLVYPALHQVWNQPLKKEVNDFQYLPRVECILAGKFRYIRERKFKISSELISSLPEPFYSDLAHLPQEGYFVYPLCTSSNYFAFSGEYKFIKDLASLLADTGLTLYLRPYPLAPKEDRKQLEKIPNVIVGLGTKTTAGGDVLNENAQNHKYLLIKNAHQVINVGTTFAIDAALCGTDVLQLRLDNPDLKNRYGDFFQYSQGLHIIQYFWTSNSISFHPEIKDLFTVENNETAHRFSKEMAKWVEYTEYL